MQFNQQVYAMPAARLQSGTLHGESEMFHNLKIKTLVISVVALLIALMSGIGALGIYSADYSVGVVRDVSLADQKNISTQSAYSTQSGHPFHGKLATQSTPNWATHSTPWRTVGA